MVVRSKIIRPPAVSSRPSSCRNGTAPGARTLRSFLVLADELNFRRAAQLLHLSQPALSHQIARLERELDVRLLERDSRRVILTEAGAHFRDRIGPAIDLLDRAATTALRAATQGRHFYVGYLSWTSPTFVSATLRRLRHQAPGLTAMPRCWGFADHPNALLTGQADAGLLWLEESARMPVTVSADIVTTQPRVVVLPVGHPASGRPSLRVHDIADETFIDVDDMTGSGWSDFWSLASVRGQRGRLSSYAASTADDMLTATAAGLGITTAPPALVDYRSRPDLRFVPLIDAEPVRLAVVWSEKCEVTARHFSNAVRHELAAHNNATGG